MGSYRWILSSLDFRDRNKFIFLTALRVSLVFFDLLGLAFLGIAATLLAGGKIQESSTTGRVLSSLEQAGLLVNFQVIGLLAVSLFISKTVLSLVLNYRSASMLAEIEAAGSARLFSRVSSSQLDDLDQWSQREILHGVTNSASFAFGGSLLALSNLLSEVILIFAVFSYLALSDWQLLLGLVGYFGVIAVLMQLVVRRRLKGWALIGDRASVRSMSVVLDYLSNRRQILSENQSMSFRAQFGDARRSYARSGALISSVSVSPRYIAEAAMVTGAALLVFTQSDSNGITNPSATAIFIAGAFRVMASLVSLQGSMNKITELREGTRLARELNLNLPSLNSESNKSLEHSVAGAPSVSVHELSYQYRNNDKLVLNKVTLEIPAGGLLVVKGPSGVGKSTLADLLLGLRTPTSGAIQFNGLNLEVYLKTHGKIGYVPQQTPLIEGTFAENIALSFDNTSIDLDKVLSAAKKAELQAVLDDLPDGLHSSLSGPNITLSGGQSQRLGIARALYNESNFLVFDEVTSALDEDSALAISKTINSLKGDHSILVITHRGESLLEYDELINL